MPLRESSEGNEDESLDAKRKKSFPKGLEDQSAEPKSRPQKSKTNISWSQKSAWKDLIGKKADSSFQFSSVVPSVPSTKEDQPDSSSIMPSNSSAKVDLSRSLCSVPSIASAKVKQPQSSHSIACISSTMEEQSRSGDLNVITNSTSEEKQNTLHGNPQSEIMQLKDQQDVKAPALASQDDVLIKTARGASWRQKSSWTQLVADANKNSFSISQFLPGLSFETQAPSQPIATDAAANTSNGEDQNLYKLDKQENTGHGLEVKNRPLRAVLSNSDVKSTVEPEQTKGSTVGGNREGTALKLDNRRPLIRKPISVADFGETCSFMRNADSLKEWAKAKASLSNSLKKKREPEEK